MTAFALTDKEQHRILSDGESTCDPGLSLGRVLDLLVDANMQEDDEDEFDDARYEAKASAEAALFQLATERATRARSTR